MTYPGFSPSARTVKRTPIMMLALEPRFMFDAAGAATTAQPVPDAPVSQGDGDHAQAADLSAADVPATTAPPTSDDAGGARTEVVFVVGNVAGLDQLLASLRGDVEVIRLPQDGDALTAMADALAGRHDIDAIHIVSHGAEGQLQLGDVTLDSADLATHASELAVLGQSLTADGDILLYGCDVAQGSGGQAFIDALATATGADIAASTDTTGKSGDWDLEANTGTIDTHSAFDGTLIGDYAYDLAPVDVSFDVGNNTNATTQSVTSGDGITVTVSATYNGNTAYVASESGAGGYYLLTDSDGNLGSDALTVPTTFVITIEFSEPVQLTGLNLYEWDLGGGYLTTDTLTVVGYDENNAQVGTPKTMTEFFGPNSDQEYAADAGALFGSSQVSKITITFTENAGEVPNSMTIASLQYVSTPNQAPVFDSSATMSISENAANGAAVGTAHAADPESAAVSYSITGGTGSSLFSIDPSTGAITVNSTGASTLNYESATSYTLTVRASDGVKTTDQAVTVNVTNQAPVVAASQGVSVNENASNGTAVATVTNTGDTDGITWSITGGNTGGAFAVDSTGHVTVADSSALNFESTPSFTLTVRASDGVINADQTVTVTLNDINEAPVVTSAATMSVSENAANGATVGTVTSTDPEGTPRTYSITGGTGSSLFSIDSSTGAITVNATGAAALDYESAASYTLFVRASDGINNTDQTVTVTITDEAPAVTPGQSFTIAENLTNGSAVGTVVATGDTDGITWSITGGNTGGAFAIDPVTGAITVATASAVDFETNPSFTLTVQATDGVTPSSQTVTITLTDTNDPPVITSGASMSVSENAANGTAVGTVTSTDPESDPRTYSITGGTGSSLFDIDSSTGAITVNATGAAALDYESAASYTLFVRASDGINNTDQTVTVTITDEAPAVTPGQSFTIAENLTNGSAVGTVVATGDTDGITWSITGGNTGGAFAIDPVTGAITVATASAVDFETNPSFTLTLRASDGTTDADQTVTITLTDANDPPVITSGASMSVSENAANGAAVGTVTSTDPENDPRTYSITGGTGSSLFSIDSSTGAITLNATGAAALDHDSTGSYTLFVRASDGTNNTDQTVTVTITDEAPAVAATQTVSLNENSGAGTAVATVVNTGDPDGITWSIVSGNTGGAFTIDTSGHVTVATPAALDFETSPSFTLTVRASDGTTDADQTITVTLNNLTPTITAGQNFSLTPTAAVTGATVGTVALTGDTADAAWAIAAGNTGNAFAIDPATGAITVAAASVPAGTYTLTIEAVVGADTATRTVTVVVAAPADTTTPTPNSQLILETTSPTPPPSAPSITVSQGDAPGLSTVGAGALNAIISGAGNGSAASGGPVVTLGPDSTSINPVQPITSAVHGSQSPTDTVSNTTAVSTVSPVTSTAASVRAATASTGSATIISTSLTGPGAISPISVVASLTRADTTGSVVSGGGSGFVSGGGLGGGGGGFGSGLGGLLGDGGQQGGFGGTKLDARATDPLENPTENLARTVPPAVVGQTAETALETGAPSLSQRIDALRYQGEHAANRLLDLLKELAV